MAGAALPAHLEPSLADSPEGLVVLYDDGCVGDYPDRRIDPDCRCGAADEGASSSAPVVLLGDSHAAMWFPGLDAAAWQCPDGFCPPVLGAPPVYTNADHVNATFAARTAAGWRAALAG